MPRLQNNSNLNNSKQYINFSCGSLNALAAIISWSRLNSKPWFSSILWHFLGSSLTGSVIMDIVYGIKMLPDDDPYASLLEKQNVVVAAVPGKFWVVSVHFSESLANKLDDRTSSPGWSMFRSGFQEQHFDIKQICGQGMQWRWSKSHLKLQNGTLSVHFYLFWYPWYLFHRTRAILHRHLHLTTCTGYRVGQACTTMRKPCEMLLVLHTEVCCSFHSQLRLRHRILAGSDTVIFSTLQKRNRIFDSISDGYCYRNVRIGNAPIPRNSKTSPGWAWWHTSWQPAYLEWSRGTSLCHCCGLWNVAMETSHTIWYVFQILSDDNTIYVCF